MEEPSSTTSESFEPTSPLDSSLKPCYVDLEVLKAIPTVKAQQEINGVPAKYLGLGSQAKENLEYRGKMLNKPGAPFGGIGFFDPKTAGPPPDGSTFGSPPEEATAEFVKKTKLDEFLKCAKGEDSFYVWCLQPIYDGNNGILAAEILVRCKNGADISAPFEDILALCDPQAGQDVKDVYVQWKAAEIVDWSLKALKEKGMDKIHHISSNLRPLDLDTSSAVYAEVKKRIDALGEEDKELLMSKVVIEITEDQKAPSDEPKFLQSWKELGFKIAYDDGLGDKAADALKGASGDKSNYHVISSLKTVLKLYNYVKVDIDWAGFCLFLSHPAYATQPAKKAEVLEKAKTEGNVYMPKGPALASIGKHEELLEEFAEFALDIIAKKEPLPIVIELTVNPADENNAYALGILKDKYKVDMFGEHKDYFVFQGGPTGAKAFEPAPFGEALLKATHTPTGGYTREMRR